MKTKRFIYEYRNYTIKGLNECRTAGNEKLINYLIARINKYVMACENGLISPHETVKAISGFYEIRNDENTKNYIEKEG